MQKSSFLDSPFVRNMRRGSCNCWGEIIHLCFIDARVHIQLSYAPTIYRNDPDDLLVLQLWDVQMYPPMAPSLNDSD